MTLQEQLNAMKEKSEAMIPANTQGMPVESRSLLESGPMVLTFYRGGW